jgi:glutathione S-transferase
MQAMRLYDYQHAPSPRRVRMYLAEKALEVPTVQVDLRRGGQFDESFQRVSSGMVVPVLELDDGTCIAESMAICRYFEALHPEPPLFGRDARESALVEMWSRRAEFEGYIAVAEVLRNTHPRFAGRGLPGVVSGVEQIAALVDRGKASWRRFIGRVDAQLAGRAYLVGDAFTVADITAFVAVDFARVAELPCDGEHLQRWHAAIAARPSARA